MSEIRVFRVGDKTEQLVFHEAELERKIQTLIENNMKEFFGVTLLQSEWSIKDGRMDSIGLDDNNCPVIFEYKRSRNDSVINQGLYYLDWLLEHKSDFKMLVREKLGEEACDKIDFSAPSVICVAGDFTTYDLHAVKQIDRNIKLVRYGINDNDMVMFEYLNAPTTKIIDDNSGETGKTTNIHQKTHLEKLESIPEKMRLLYEEICDYIESLDDDISSNQLKYYIAYRNATQNVICIELYNSYIAIRTKLNPEDNPIIKGFTRDMRGVGHYGTGDYEIELKNESQLEKAKELIAKAVLG